MLQALQTGVVTPLKSVNPFIDGAAVGMPGINTHRVLTQTLNELVLIPEGHCCMSLLDIF
jgi:threonine dehydratase